MPLPNLGTPFGSPHQTTYRPAPVGSERAGQELQQALNLLGQSIGKHFADKKAAGQENQDLQSLQQYGTDQQQYAQQGQPDLSSLAQAGLQFNRGEDVSVVSPGTQQPFIEQPQFPQLQSQRFRSLAAPQAVNQTFAGQQPFSLGPGQRRFSGSGQQIAEVPPTTRTVSAAQQKAQRIDAEIAHLESIKSPTDTQARRLNTLKEAQLGLDTARSSDRPEYWKGLGFTTKESKANARLAAEIKAGFKERATASKEVNKQPLTAQLKFWQAMEKSATGQYYVLDEVSQKNNPEVAAIAGQRIKEVMDKMKAVGQSKTNKNASKPTDYPDAEWSEEHGMWTVIRDGRLKGVK